MRTFDVFYLLKYILHTSINSLHIFTVMTQISHSKLISYVLSSKKYQYTLNFHWKKDKNEINPIKSFFES